MTQTATKSSALDELRPGQQWICFDKDKVPYNPLTGQEAKANDASTWATYEQAEKASRRYQGIGREFLKDQGITGIDLDHCIDDQGQLTPFAQETITRLDSYTEYSPSGRGLHIWVYGSIPKNHGADKDADGENCVEMYDCKRYFTITGKHFPGTPTTIENRQEVLLTIHTEVSARRQTAKAKQRASKPRATAPTKNTQANGNTPYGLKALADECAILASTSEGGRNQRLNDSAFSMGQLVGGHELSRATVEQDLSGAAARAGLDDREIESTLRSGIEAGMQSPRSAPTDTQTQAAAPGDNEEKSTEPEKEKGDSQALKLVKMALAEAELFSTSKGERYARLTINGRVETLIITEKGGAFKRWLIHRYLSGTGNIPNATALSSAIGVLEAEAQFGDRPQREVYIRLAYHRRKLYLDLANTRCEVVEISSQGWKIITDAPVEFRRPNGMLPLPNPVHGGSLDELKPFVNISQKDWILYLAWLVGALHPTGPYPILDLNSERGSAKSTTTKVSRMLIDPSKAPLRREPKDDQTFAIMAYNNYVVAFDNLSHISTRMSDNLCTLATGAGDAYRSLYTNDEEHIFDARRPQVFNGIEELATRGDLIDRCIILNLPEIEKAKRRDERSFWNEFNQAHPRILGALLDAVVMALKNLPHTKLAETPRMADFALWVQAAEPALTTKPGTFLEVYEKNREEGIATEIEASPIGNALLALMKENPHYEVKCAKLSPGAK